VLDGVFVEGETGEPVFHGIRGPGERDLQEIVEEVRKRVERRMRRWGARDDGALDEGDDAQVVMQCASAGDRVASGERSGRRVGVVQGDEPAGAQPRRSAESGYFNLHAGVRIGARDRTGVERLLRYMLRPPFSLRNLTKRSDGRLELRFERAWRDGTRGVVLTPFEFLERLAALVPKPREKRIQYHGILAPAARMRSRVVPKPEEERERRALGSRRSRSRKAKNMRRSRPKIPWADLLRRTFGVDSLRCRCGARLRVHAVIMGAAAVAALGTLRRSAKLISRQLPGL
jgi:hypothetical protein